MLMGGWEYSCIVLIGWGKSQSYWLKYSSGNSFIRACSDEGSQHRQAGSAGDRQLSAGFSLKGSLCERLLSRNGC